MYSPLFSQGYYCDLRLSPANGSLPRLCPKGHYCPAGTSMSKEYPCPVGSFNPREHVDSLSGCMPCPSGHYCPSLGLSEPAGLITLLWCDLYIFIDVYSWCFLLLLLLILPPIGSCLAGFWCKGGASSPTPVDGLSGSKCPLGHYCPAGD